MKKEKDKIAIISELYGSKRHGGENQAAYNLYKEIDNHNIVDFFSYNTNKKINIKLPTIIKYTPTIRDIFAVPILGILFEAQYSNNYRKTIVTSPTITLLCKKNNNYVLWLHNCRTIKIKKFIKQKKYKLLFNPLSLFIFKTIENICYKKYNEIYCITNELREKLINEFHLSPDRVKIQGNIVDKKIFYKNKKIKKIYDYIFVGRGSYQKGFDIVIKMAKEESTKKYLAIVNLVEKEFIDKIPNNIKIIYKVPNKEMSYYYNQARNLILPSRDEEQPLVILEALWCGIDILASKEALRNINMDKLTMNKDNLYKIINYSKKIEFNIVII